MFRKLDPTQLSHEELLTEWSIREEELRLQNETLRTTQDELTALITRYERIFAEAPVPALIIDGRGFVLEANKLAVAYIPELDDNQNFFLPRSLDNLSQNLLFDAISLLDGVNEISRDLNLNWQGKAGIQSRLLCLESSHAPDSYALIFAGSPAT